VAEAHARRLVRNGGGVTTRGKRVLTIGLIVVAAVVVVAAAGFLAWTQIAGYSAFPEAAALAESHGTAQGWYVFEPAEPAGTGLIFYPGGLVDPAAYAPLMERVSGHGILAVIVPMPLGLAVLGAGRASEVIAAYPEVDRWIVGGHSLGGSMAASFAGDNPEAVQGLALLASYPGGSTDLSARPLAAVSIYGTEDGVAGDGPATALDRLPPGTALVVIEGGNHAQFGDYGPQKGDGVPTISREEQQRRTAAAIAELSERLRP
jgi:hypothetical protein